MQVVLRSDCAALASRVMCSSMQHCWWHAQAPQVLANMQVGYFHGYIDGVDYVFVDHACYNGRQGDIYGGDRQSIMFRHSSSHLSIHPPCTYPALCPFLVCAVEAWAVEVGKHSISC